MDVLTIGIGTIAALGLVGLAWLGGYELGCSRATEAERQLSNRRVGGLLDSMNQRPPAKAARNRRKAARKAVRA